MSGVSSGPISSDRQHLWRHLRVQYRSVIERIRSMTLAKPERASALMRRTPWHRHVDAKARGYKTNGYCADGFAACCANTCPAQRIMPN